MISAPASAASTSPFFFCSPFAMTKHLSLLPLRNGWTIATLLLATACPALNAQAADDAALKAAVADEPGTTSEILNSYRLVREQLQATQFALAANRLEAEANARVQTAIAEKIESIRSTMEAERERHLIETDRLNADRERQRLEIERANAVRDREQAETRRFTQTIFWIALAFGSVGLVAVIIVPLIQWRALKRLAEYRAEHPALPAGDEPGDLLEPGTASTADTTVALSNRRLLSVIDRMEQRIFELEHTAARPLPAATAHPFGSAGSTSGTPPIFEPLDRIAPLMQRGRALLEAGKAREALSCFDEILKLDLNHAEALVKRGAALEELKQDDEAIQCYDRALKIDPKMTLAYLHKGGICNRLQRYEESLKCYEQALRTEAEEKQNSGSRSPLPGSWTATRSLSAS
jgi:tetratricopeptide (TPR) repeat protein